MNLQCLVAFQETCNDNGKPRLQQAIYRGIINKQKHTKFKSRKSMSINRVQNFGLDSVNLLPIKPN